MTPPSAHPDSPLPSHRLHLLEGLRGYMAWWVVLYHYLSECGFMQQWLPSVGKILMVGGYAVDVFIILSGFVISHLLTTQKTSFAEFIGRRFFRLYPLFFVCILAGFISFKPTLAVYQAFGAKFQITQPLAMWESYREHVFTYLSLCLTMLHGAVPNAWLPYAQAPFDSPSWSISLEWQFYLLFPLILFGVRKRPWLTLVLVLFAVLFRDRYNIGDWGSFLPQRAEYFAVGILSYHFFRVLTRIQNEAKSSVPWTMWTLVILVLLVTPLRDLVMHPYDVGMGDWLPLTIWILVFAVLVETHAPSPSKLATRVAGIFLNPVAQFLGKVSYSTYLLHYFLIYAVMALIVAVKLPPNKYYALAAMVAIAAPLTVAISALSFRFVEKPGIEWGRRWIKNR